MNRFKAMADKEPHVSRHVRPKSPVDSMAILQDRGRHKEIVEEAIRDMYLENVEDYRKYWNAAISS